MCPLVCPYVLMASSCLGTACNQKGPTAPKVEKKGPTGGKHGNTDPYQAVKQGSRLKKESQQQTVERKDCGLVATAAKHVPKSMSSGHLF